MAESSRNGGSGAERAQSHERASAVANCPSTDPKGAGRSIPDRGGSLRGARGVNETPSTDPSTLIVSESFEGARVDHFLREMLHLSRARLTRLFASGEVTVDDRPAKKGQQ